MTPLHVLMMELNLVPPPDTSNMAPLTRPPLDVLSKRSALDHLGARLGHARPILTHLGMPSPTLTLDWEFLTLTH